MNDKIPIIKSALIITIIGAIGRVLGFIREIVIADLFGIGIEADAYSIAMRLIGMISMLVHVYLTTIFVPTYARIKETRGEKMALWATNNALGVSLFISIILMLLTWLIAPIGFDGLAIIAINIMIFQLPLLAFSQLFVGFLTARKSFIGPNAIGLPSNIIFIVVIIILGTASGVVGLSVAAVLSVLAQVIMLYIWSLFEKYRYKFVFKINDPEIKSDMRLLFPAVLGGGLTGIQVWISTMVAARLDYGIPAAINYSTRLSGFVTSMVILPLVGIAYSYISTHAAKNDKKHMLDTLWTAVKVLLFIIIPIVVISMPRGFDLVKIVYERGEFDAYATVITGQAFIWLLPSLAGIAISYLLARFFYALKDTKTPMYSSIIIIIIHIAFSIWLSQIWGIIGLALAMSISSILAACFLVILLRRKLGALGFKKTMIDIIKMLICAIPCAVSAFITGQLINTGSIIRFFISAIIGLIVYILSAFILKEDIMQEALILVHKKRKR